MSPMRDQSTFHGNVLITSRKTGRFMVPKGWPMKGKSGRKAAVTEAREEAGVAGKALKEPLGAYSYWKRLSNRFVNVTVTVYLLEVVDTLPDWKESAQRKRAWLSPADAATLIDEPQLASLVRSMIVPS
ncbi:NUDIX hydrolase [Mesorhizobium sp. LjNodule214]|uniref:NUDIX hydrolase n=1 Tax=Mesorhizobium sp. LjNodule214 TaxID=3342252 RepID=UPI003ED13A5D